MTMDHHECIRAAAHGDILKAIQNAGNRKGHTMKTAEELGIAQDVYEALIGVADELEAGKLRHVSLEASNEGHKEPPIGPDLFNMGQWGYECGTAHCIGGWVQRRVDRAGFDHNCEGSPALHDLFYPESWCGLPDPVQYNDITAAQAVEAIRKYLDTGVADWSHIPDPEVANG